MESDFADDRRARLGRCRRRAELLQRFFLVQVDAARSADVVHDEAELEQMLGALDGGLTRVCDGDAPTAAVRPAGFPADGPSFAGIVFGRGAEAGAGAVLHRNPGVQRLKGDDRTGNNLARLIAFALEPLAQRFALPADRFGLLARAAFGRLLVGAAPLHLAEHALALKLLLQDAQRLTDVVVADENLQNLLLWPVPAESTRTQRELLGRVRKP